MLSRLLQRRCTALLCSALPSGSPGKCSDRSGTAALQQAQSFGSAHVRRCRRLDPRRQAQIKQSQLRTAVQSFAAARAASAQVEEAPQGGGLRWPPLPPDAGSAAQLYGSLCLPDTGRTTRLRQHVNPFKPALQRLPDPVDWSSVYDEPRKPLAVDIGCATGRWMLLLARDSGMSCNYLGLDIRAPLIERATEWAQQLGISGFVDFRIANATLAFDHLLSTYPGPLELVAIQCPDPQFKTRHHKRRIVQASLVDAIAQRLSPSGSIYLSSDVEEVAVDMRRQFEERASDRLQVSALHNQLPTFSRSEGSHSANSAPKQDTASGSVPQHQQAASAWAAKGWLQANPTGLETERELSVLRQGLPMYRMVLCRKQQ